MPRSRLWSFLALSLAVAGLMALAFSACIPSYTFGESSPNEGGTSGDGGGITPTPDSSSSFDSPFGQPDALPPTGDASSDSPTDTSVPPPPPSDGSIVAVTVADAGASVGATGYGYQRHLIFAQNDNHYWFFYRDDVSTRIETLSSADAVTWSAGAPIALPSGFNVKGGNNFSVAYANLSGRDVVHLVANVNSGGANTYETVHIRATIAGGVLTTNATLVLPTSTNGSTCPDDGPAAIVSADGHTFDVTAWTDHGSDSTTCDTDVYESSGADTGSAWDAGSFGYVGYYVSLPSFAYSHDLVSLPDAGQVLLLYPDEDNQALTSFDSIGWAISPSFIGGIPGQGGGARENPSDELFASTPTFQASSNDWSDCRLTDGAVHVVRHRLTGSGTVGPFQEVVYNGSTWQTTVAPPAASNGISNSGVALVSGTDPTRGLLLATLGADNALNVARWTSSGGWTSVGSLPGTNNRQSLAGSGCGSHRPMVFWTETTGGTNVIESADLSGFLN